MVQRISRREFIQKSIGGAALVGASSIYAGNSQEKVGQVVLGKSGLHVSRLAMGTGSAGWKRVSNQTKLGKEGFVKLGQHAYDRGINFWDTADIYGSHEYFKELQKHIPRDKVVIMSKLWVKNNDWLQFTNAQEYLDRFLLELGVDRIDLLLVHCMTSADWQNEFESVRDTLSAAKEKGVIRAHGVSCHSVDALNAAAESDWVDVILTRINHTGERMDDTPEKVMPIIQKAHDRGIGVIGMKIMGMGKFTNIADRQKSMEYVWGSGNVDAMTIGFEKTEHIDEAVKRTNLLIAG